MSRPKVLLTSSDIPQSGIDLMKEHCELVIVDKVSPSRSDIIFKAKDVDAIFWCTKHRLDSEILDAAGPQIKVVSTMSAGVNHIDVDELKKRGIKFGHTPGVLDNTVAETAVLLALAASRRLNEGRRKIERSEWETRSQWMLGQDIAGSTVGIVGLGGIGTAVVKRLKSFQVSRFLYCGHREKPHAKEIGAEFVPFDVLVKESDFIIAACPLNEETKGMFNSSAFKSMKNSAVFVNVARGEVAVQEDLIEALKNRTIFAAGLDVMTPEPLPNDSELLKLENCVLLPHLGSATLKTRSAMSSLAAENILRALKGEKMVAPYL